MRRSYKFKVTCIEHQPMLDYVFGADEDEARLKVVQHLDIPENAQFHVVRVSDITNLPMRLT